MHEHCENAQRHKHEVFVHHFRLPRRGEEMAHFFFFLCVCIEKRAHLPQTGKCAQTVGDEYDMPLLHVVLH